MHNIMHICMFLASNRRHGGGGQAPPRTGPSNEPWYSGLIFEITPPPTTWLPTIETARLDH